jgi:hypothetical protein
LLLLQSIKTSYRIADRFQGLSLNFVFDTLPHNEQTGQRDHRQHDDHQDQELSLQSKPHLRRYVSPLQSAALSSE